MSSSLKIGALKFKVLYPNLLRDLTAEEREGLKAHIQSEGRIVYPVIVDEGMGIIDGENRVRIAIELGFEDVPYSVLSGLSESQKRDMAVALNFHRRQMSAEDRKKVVKEKKSEGKSNRQIADEIGTSEVTVRRDLHTILAQEIAEIPEKIESTATYDAVDITLNPPTHEAVEVVVGKDGKSRPGISDKTKQQFQMVQRKGCQALKDALSEKRVSLKKAAELANLPVAQQTAALSEKGKNKDADPPPESDFKDSLGNPIPKSLRDVFADRMLYDASDSISKIIKDLKAAQKWCVYVRLSDAVGALETAKQAIEDGIPEVVHQACGGKGCAECRNAGWMPMWRMEELEAAG